MNACNGSERPLGISDFQQLFDDSRTWERWGPDDQRGTLNLISAAHVARAGRLVREGVTVGCGLPLDTVPGVDNPVPAIHLMARTGDAIAPPAVSSTADWLMVMPHGPAHTHLDALCHYSWAGQLYNGRPVAEVSSTGARWSDVTVGADGIVSRGILLDIPRSMASPWLEPGTAIRIDDLERAEIDADVRVSEGDIVFVRTGRHRRRAELGAWDVRTSLAGLHHECVRWLADRGVAVLGCDGGSDVIPHAFEGVALPIHTLMIVARGTQLLDNVNLEPLADACAARRRWEYFLSIAPLRLPGGTASAVNPIATF